MISPRLERLGQWVWATRFPLIPVLLGVAVALPSLGNGLFADDYSIRATVCGLSPVDGVQADPWNPFTWANGSIETNRMLIRAGVYPWWTQDDVSIRFMRPLTAATHMLDFRGWSTMTWLMHVQCVAWYGALVMVAAMAYRTVAVNSLAPWAIGLAAILFAMDDTHSTPVGWLANRNSLISGLFGLLCITFHVRFRRDGWSPGAVLSPLCLAVGLLAKEEAICATAYLFAFTVCLDRGTWRRRFAALLPCLAVSLVWHVAYRQLGYGATNSAIYADPVHDPLLFAMRILRNAPLLLGSQFAFPSADVSNILSADGLLVHWAWAIGIVAAVTLVCWHVVCADPIARFWAIGMLISVLPVCAIFPGDRLMMFPSFGAAGLIATWIHYTFGRFADARLMPRSAKHAMRFIVLMYLVVSPAAFALKSAAPRFAQPLVNEFNAMIPDDDAFADQTAVFVNSPLSIADVVWILERRQSHRPVPKDKVVLLPSGGSGTMTRTDDRTIVVRPEGGYTPPRGRRPGDDHSPWLSVQYMVQHLDMLGRREDARFSLGETVELPAVTIEITELTDDRRAAEATFRFDKPLSDDSLRWLVSDTSGYSAFDPPAIGETVTIESPFARLGYVGE
jgi:hypothetical protein